MHEMLKNMRVLDFTMNAAGPSCAGNLADYGATVIKVERPGSGDDNRQFPPMMDGQGFIHFWCNRGKKSVTLNLKDPEGLAIAKKLALSCDVLLESYRPGIMKKFGLDYETLHAEKPELIYCSISAYGQTGPYANRPGYDLIAQATAGLMELNGDPNSIPLKSGMALGDYWDGLNAYAAVVSAWFHRLRTGTGQHIDASLLQNLVYHNNAVLDCNIGVYATRSGNDNPHYSPYGVFRAPGGRYAVICVCSDQEWQALCRLMGCKTAGLETNDQRIRERSRISLMIEEWLAGFDDVMDAVQQMEKAGIPCCRVAEMQDVMEDPHFRSQNWIVEAELPDDIKTMRRWYTRGLTAFFSKTPGFLKKAPVLGDGNYQILGEIGLNKNRVDELMAKWTKMS